MPDVLPPPLLQPTVPDVRAATGVVLLLAACWGAVTAICIGVPVGVLTYMASSASCATSSDSWCELGALIFGAFAGFVTALVGYLVAGIVSIVRRRPAGDRATPIGLFIATPVLAFALLSVTIGLL